METIEKMLKSLTTEDLRQWAGTTIFNRGKSYLKNVDGLSRTDDGALAAWVYGSDDYATSVGLDPDGELEYVCTCPYEEGPCKHAVAVLLSAAERVKRKEEIPLLEPDDELFLTLFDDFDEEDYDADEEDYDADEDWDDEEYQPVRPQAAAGKKPNKAVGKILEKMSKEELIALLLEQAASHPEIERGILEREQISSGNVDKVVNSLRREIRNLTAEPAWHNHWRGERNIPDYSHVQEQFTALLAKGHADAVLQLGEELWTLGNRQVEESHDDGETAMEISQCLDVVLRAVPRTSLSPARQLLWVIDRELEDQFSLLAATTLVDDKRYLASHWAEVADILEKRLNRMAKPAPSRFGEGYRRQDLMGTLVKAYERGGSKDKVIPLLEKEADACQCYGKLADALLCAGKREDARRWCITGYQRTLKNTPGIAARLQERLREMARTETNHPLVAAYRAQDFFETPCRKNYTELRAAAEKIGAWPKVREAALQYLRTGKRPDAKEVGRESAWPLPAPEVGAGESTSRDRFPDLHLLIDLAILEKRLDDVVALYADLRKAKRWGFHFETDKAVASAVEKSHPQTALGIWRYMVDNLIGQVKPKAYEEAAVYLRRMSKVYQATKRVDEWQSLLSALRKEHKPKRRLMEVLDSLSAPVPLV